MLHQNWSWVAKNHPEIRHRRGDEEIFQQHRKEKSPTTEDVLVQQCVVRNPWHLKAGLCPNMLSNRNHSFYPTLLRTARVKWLVSVKAPFPLEGTCRPQPSAIRKTKLRRTFHEFAPAWKLPWLIPCFFGLVRTHCHKASNDNHISEIRSQKIRRKLLIVFANTMKACE